MKSHNEWFRPVNLKAVYEDAINLFGEHYRRLVGFVSSRKSCPNCKSKLCQDPGQLEYVWSWGEYVSGRWRTVRHFCKICFQSEVADKLRQHAAECGCEIELVGYHTTLPAWLTLETECDCDKLPEFDMDGSYFDGVCRKCQARQEAEGVAK